MTFEDFSLMKALVFFVCLLKTMQMIQKQLKAIFLPCSKCQLEKLLIVDDL